MDELLGQRSVRDYDRPSTERGWLVGVAVERP